jgi:hypothetical protein
LEGRRKSGLEQGLSASERSAGRREAKPNVVSPVTNMLPLNAIRVSGFRSGLSGAGGIYVPMATENEPRTRPERFRAGSLNAGSPVFQEGLPPPTMAGCWSLLTRHMKYSAPDVNVQARETPQIRSRYSLVYVYLSLPSFKDRNSRFTQKMVYT